MIDFAVWHEGMEEGRATWALAVKDDAVLLSTSEGTLYWKAMDECKLVKVHTPEMPVMVLPVQTQQQTGLAIPEPNRQMRRNGF